ncbi:MAG: trypsin-like peptidase domain-containing protein [Thermoguttaceae bacterium]
MFGRDLIWCCLVLAVVGSASVVRGADASQDVLLVVFSSPNDAACRRMTPLIDELAASNMPILRVDGAQSPELVAKYGVTTYPTLIALAGGLEVDRVVGSADPIVLKPRVVRMFEQAKAHLATVAAATLPVVTPQTMVPTAAALSPAVASPDRVSVRLKVTDTQGYSWGTGTIIDTRQGSALILTCGHIFRESRGMGAVEVHVFQDGKPYAVSGRCLRYNLENDLALVEIRVPATMVGAIRLAPEGHRLEVGQSVTSIGCNGGDNPTAKPHRIISLDKVSTPPSHSTPFYYIQVSGAPVSGRSGGGLFTDDGYLVGVCNTADPQTDDGHFVPASVIRGELDAANLAVIYREPSVESALREPPRLPSVVPSPMVAAQTPQQLPAETNVVPANFLTANGQSVVQAAAQTVPLRNEVAFREGGVDANDTQLVSLAPAAGAVAASGQRQLTPQERSTLQEIQRRQEAGDEVIIIVRPRNNAQAPSDVIVLQAPSDPFLAALGGAATR